MWTLPLQKGITIRRVERPLRALVERAGGSTIHVDLSRSPWSWDDSRLSVVITSSISLPRTSPHISAYNTLADSFADAAVVALRGPGFKTSLGSYIQRELLPGEVFCDRRSVPTLYVRQLWDTARMLAELDVARDAILEAPQETVPQSAYRIAREVLPHAHGLFVALIRKERQSLRGESWE